MKKTRFQLLVLFFAIVCFLGAGVPAANAYDKDKCDKYITKLKKWMKPHRSLKFKVVYANIKDISKAQAGRSKEEEEKFNGWDVETIKTKIDVPFKDLSWTKKFIKYYHNVEQYCGK